MELAMAKLDVYSPSIQRAHHRSTKAQGHYSKGERCLRIVRGFEFYFTIFTSDAWSKFYARLLLNDHPGGCGYDLCFDKALPGLVAGVDHRISAIDCNLEFHRLPFLPESRSFSFYFLQFCHDPL